MLLLSRSRRYVPRHSTRVDPPQWSARDMIDVTTHPEQTPEELLGWVLSGLDDIETTDTPFAPARLH